MTKIRDIARASVLPAFMGQPRATSFEIDLRQKFESLQRQMNGGRLAIDLLSHPTVEGYDYRFLVITRDVYMHLSVDAIPNPALILDLSKPFDAQWPRDFIGLVENPHQLKEDYFYGRLPAHIPKTIIKFPNRQAAPL